MQNVGTPRFYIDLGLYQQSIGAWTPEDAQVSLVQLNPTNIVGKPDNHITVPRISPIRYIAFLGHNGGSYYPGWKTGIEDNTGTEVDESLDSPDDFTEVINMSGYDTSDEEYSGFSIGVFSDNTSATGLSGIVENPDSTLGAVSIGNYYDMPHSPDLNLNLSYEYDGVKNIQTKSGATLSNASYTKPADWGDIGAWQLSPSGQAYISPTLISGIRTGRRVWQLNFSYLSESDIMPLLGTQSYESVLTEDILSGTDFFSVVWNKTLGNALPFIFQPDNTNNNPDQFAICKFVDNTLQYELVAHNVYNIKFKIEEVW